MSRRREPTEADFLKDVATHQMTIVKDDGVYRHLRFARPGTYCMSFNVVTWPGYLAYAGDIGEFMFSRLHDMFEFFRDNRGGTLRINTSYWGEKCRAADTSGQGIKAYSPERFKENIADWLERMDQDHGTVNDDLHDAVRAEVLSFADDGIYAAMRAAQDFTHEGRHIFTDFWECDPTEYTWHFVWCCYAIAWGIRQYDAAKAASKVSAA